MKDKEKRIEDLKNSCVNCGRQYWTFDPCCSKPYLVKELLDKQPMMEEVYDMKAINHLSTIFDASNYKHLKLEVFARKYKDNPDIYLDFRIIHIPT